MSNKTGGDDNMILKKWDDIPFEMKNPEVKKYYDLLSKKKISLVFKRVFDIFAALVMLIVLVLPMLVIALIITLDSDGGVFYRQERVTTYGKKFRIHKFRTMIANADKVGSLVTVSQDKRITKVGAFLRKYRLDELPQLFDVLEGTMSFVGTRPEAVKYVEGYTDEMKATLLLPAGITSEASIRYKDEAELLNDVDNVDEVYINEVLPAKMRYNLWAIENFSFWEDIATMARTVFAVLGKDYVSQGVLTNTQKEEEHAN